MKNIKSIFLGALVMSGLVFWLVGCVGEVGVGGGYYGRPWYNDGPWFDGPGWGAPVGRVGIDIHPPGFRR
jgi:hypothetical protein